MHDSNRKRSDRRAPPGHPQQHSWSEEDQEGCAPRRPRPSDQGDERSAEALKAYERAPHSCLLNSQRAQKESVLGP